jgi:hypothetical protein
MPKYVKTVDGSIVSLLRARKASGKPPANPFKPGFDERRNTGGTHFIKLYQRLSTVAAETLSQQADDELCRLVGLPTGSTKAQVVCEALFLQAASGNVGAAESLFRITEAARVRPEAPAVDLSVLERASATIRRMMSETKERKNGLVSGDGA